MDENLVVEVINKALKSSDTLKVFFKSGDQEIFPHLFIYVDGILTLIGEDIASGALVNIQKTCIKSAKLIRHKYLPNFAKSQLEEYVKELRSMNGKEDRFILKIHVGQDLEITPPYQLMLNTYVVKTPAGDTIWASTIEITPDLLDWYYDIKDKAEIIAPESLKNKFMDYLEKRLLKNSKYFAKVS